MARTALAAGQRDSARIDLEHAVTADPDNVDATVTLATLLVEDGKGGYARNLLGRALKRHPTDDRLLHFRVVRVTVDTAAARYDTLLSRNDATDETFRAAASEAIASGFYPRAEGILSRGLFQYPKSPALRALVDTLRVVRGRP